MSASLTPSKRPYDQNSTELNGKGKWHKSSGSYSQNQVKVASESNVIRVLCPASRIGSVIGKGGSSISQIRQGTDAKVKVEDPVSGSDERIIIIAGSDQETEVNSEQNKEDVREEEKVEDKVDDINEQINEDEDKDSVTTTDAKSTKKTSTIQKALLLIFEKMVEEEPGPDGGDQESDKSSTFVFRLLVLSNQVGCLLGKGGSVVKQMASESGAQIRILPRDKLPPCASASDELVQISGEVDAVRKALQSVSQQLLENPPRDNDSFNFSTASQPSHSYPPTNRSFTSQGASYAGSRDSADYHSAAKFHESGISGKMKPYLEVLSLRLLCPDERAGGVIGKGGAIIKSLQQETGCEIKVMESVIDSEDRIIIISGPVHPEDRVSPVQDAVLRVQTRIVRALPDSKEQNVMARVLVSSNQIGCLLGKGGAVIAEMRKLTGAHIRILGKDQIPKCAGEDEEVVQIHGEFEAVQEALFQITTKLRNHFFRDAFPSIDYPSNPAFSDQVPQFSSYGVRRDFSPPGSYSNLGPSFHKFDAVGSLPPHRGLHLHDDRPSFMHNIHRPGAPHLYDRKPWGSRGLAEGGGPIGIPNFAGVPHRRIPGFGGGNQPAIITSTTVEVVVPQALVPVIYGEDGECLKQIRQISDAKITITDPKPGAIETIVIISGTPEQTHAAQSLIQAFVMSETESS